MSSHSTLGENSEILRKICIFFVFFIRQNHSFIGNSLVIPLHIKSLACTIEIMPQ
jgi:hypothetical protein